MKIERPSLLHPKKKKFIRTNFYPTNFARVDDFLMRSSMPSREELNFLREKELLTDVVNVSNDCPKMAFDIEQQSIKELGLGNYLIPSETDFPKKENVEKFLRITERLKVDKKGAKVLLHCNAGVDRTGTYAVFYQLFYKIKSFPEAIAEMIKMGHWQEVHPLLIPNIEKLAKEMKLFR